MILKLLAVVAPKVVDEVLRVKVVLKLGFKLKLNMIVFPLDNLKSAATDIEIGSRKLKM